MANIIIIRVALIMTIALLLVMTLKIVTKTLSIIITNNPNNDNINNNSNKCHSDISCDNKNKKGTIILILKRYQLKVEIKSFKFISKKTLL